MAFSRASWHPCGRIVCLLIGVPTVVLCHDRLSRRIVTCFSSTFSSSLALAFSYPIESGPSHHSHLPAEATRWVRWNSCATPSSRQPRLSSTMTSRPKPRVPGYRGIQPQYEQQYEMDDRSGIPTNDKAVDESSYPPHKRTLPLHHGKKVTKGVKAQGESGRRGIHPIHFLRICFRSSCTLSKFVNILWPFVPAAFALVRNMLFLKPQLDVPNI